MLLKIIWVDVKNGYLPTIINGLVNTNKPIPTLINKENFFKKYAIIIMIILFVKENKK